MTNIKRAWQAFTAGLLIFSGFAEAASYHSNRDHDCHYAFLSPAKPITGPSNYWSGNWFVETEFLLLQTRESGLGFGVERFRPKGHQDTRKSKIKENKLHFDWNGGLRVGFGYSFPCDGWDMSASWTYIAGKGNGKVSRDLSEEHHHDECLCNNKHTRIFPAWMAVPFAVDSNKARWKTNINLVDIEMGREFFVSKFVTLRPFTGVRLAQIDQKYDLRAKVDRDSQFVSFKAETSMQCKYQGAGLRGGLDSEWGLGYGWSLYGNAALSALYGSFGIHWDYELDHVFHPDRTEQITKSDRDGAFVAMLDSSAGFRWKQFFNNDHLALTLQIGWDYYIFFNQNRFEDMLDDHKGHQVHTSQFNRGDLGAQGLNLAVKIDF